MLAQLVLSAAALAATIAQPTPVEFCMAPGGDDHGPGTVGEPFATLEGARDALRRLRAWGDLPLGGVRVLIRDGVYELAGTFELSHFHERLEVGKPGSELSHSNKAFEVMSSAQADPRDRRGVIGGVA